MDTTTKVLLAIIAVGVWREPILLVLPGPPNGLTGLILAVGFGLLAAHKLRRKPPPAPPPAA
jgi:hypothetical protein